MGIGWWGPGGSIGVHGSLGSRVGMHRGVGSGGSPLDGWLRGWQGGDSGLVL